MKRTTTQQEKDFVTFTIIVDDDVATYIEQQRILDTNAYMVDLLRKQKQQQESGRPAQPNNYTNDAPDTSGYPQIDGHFQT